MRTSRIDDKVLLQLLRNGNTIAGIARKMGMDRTTVSRRLKALKIAISRNATIRVAHKIVDREINALDQLQKINRDANELLDLLMRWNRGDEEALRVLESQVRKIKVRGREEEITDYRSKDPRELALKGHAGNTGATEAAARNLPDAFRYAGRPAISG